MRVASHASNARGVGARIRRFKAPETGTYVLVLHPVAGVAEDVPYRLATSAHLGRTKVSGRAAAAEEISFDGVEGRVVAGSLRGLRLASVVLQGPEDEPVGLTLRGAPGRALTLPPQTLSFGSGPYVLRVAPAERGKVSWALRIALPRRARSANESAAQ